MSLHQRSVVISHKTLMQSHVNVYTCNVPITKQCGDQSQCHVTVQYTYSYIVHTINSELQMVWMYLKDEIKHGHFI